MSKLIMGLLILVLCGGAAERSDKTVHQSEETRSIITGADQVERYVPYLMGKRVGMVINQTSVIGVYTYINTFFDSSRSAAMGRIEARIGKIRKSWEPGLSDYKEMRKQYLLYK